MEFANTKWDVRNWTEEQKIQFQNKGFELDYGWLHTGKEKYEKGFAFLSIDGNGHMTFIVDDFAYFSSKPYVEKTWEDMFPTPKLDVIEEIVSMVFPEDTQDEDEGIGFDNLTYLAPEEGVPNWEVSKLSDDQLQFLLDTFRIKEKPVSVEFTRTYGGGYKYLYINTIVGIGHTNLQEEGDVIVSFNDTFKEV
ncbi:conserved hypothetical protein [Vibrio phage 424E50-1]|nr:conserved hypothetical protein [Vibrio phage 424E50-1]